MRCTAPLLIALALLGGAAEARRQEAPDLGAVTLDVRDPVVQATVAGVPATLAVSFNQGVYLAPAFAARVPLAFERGDAEYVGRVQVRHREAAGEVAIAGVVTPMLMQTQDEPCCDGHDGAIGVTGLPWSTVRIGQGGGAAELRYPTAIDDQSGLNVPIKVGHDTIHIVIDPTAPETVATASAAAILSRTYGGRLLNEIRSVPVAYGINRTVRDMVLVQPADILGFPLNRIAVRIGDYAGDTQLPQPPEMPAGKDDIVVRHRPPPPQFRWAAITIGRDWLGRCSQISFYRDAGAIGLVCTAG